DGAGNLGLSSGSATIIDGHFQNPKTRARCFHLHFQRPAIGLFAQLQSLQSIPANRAKRTHVCESHTIKRAQNYSDHVAGKHLMPIHAAALALPTGTRRDHKIMSSFGYWLDQPVHHFRVIAAVAIEENANFATWRNCAETSAKGAAVAAVWFVNDSRTGSARRFCGAVCAAIINDDDFAGDLPWDGANHLSNRLLFV